MQGACRIREGAAKLLFDTSAVIGFLEEIDGEELLRGLVALGFELAFPATVDMELLEPSTRAAVERFGLFSREPVGDEWELESLKARYPRLGRGELGVIALAKRAEAAKEPYMCVLDDGRARKVAEGLGLRLTGTIGLLMRLEDGGILTGDRIRALKEQLVEGGFRFKEP